MSLSVRHVLSGALVLAFVIWQACAVYDPSLLELDDGATDSATSDVVIDAGMTCNSVHWPSRPSGDDDASTNIEFYNAVKTLDFGTGDASPPLDDIGFDLDTTCTCEGTPPNSGSCAPPDGASAVCDLEGGVDNSAGTLLLALKNTGYVDQAIINEGIAAGTFGGIIRVRNYNGQANDSAVEFAIFTSNGTNGVTPQFQGNDVWTIDPGSVKNGTIGDAGPDPTVAYDLNAYVTDFTLVANISNMPLAIGAADGTGLVTIELENAYVVIKLTPFGSSFQTAGAIVGRWDSSKLLTSLQVVWDNVDQSWVCGTDIVYQELKTHICQIQDIMSNRQLDRTDASCNALSFGMLFTGVPATYGAVLARPAVDAGCGPNWIDHCP